MSKQEIFFEKKVLGQWRRTDKDGSKFVNEESMFREIQKLAGDGWHVQPGEYGVTHIRTITVTQDERR